MLIRIISIVTFLEINNREVCSQNMFRISLHHVYGNGKQYTPEVCEIGNSQ